MARARCSSFLSLWHAQLPRQREYNYLHTLKQYQSNFSKHSSPDNGSTRHASSKVLLSTSPAATQTMGIRRSCFDQFIQLKSSCCSGDKGRSPTASSGCSEIHQSFTLHLCFASDSQHNSEKQGLGKYKTIIPYTSTAQPSSTAKGKRSPLSHASRRHRKHTPC